MKQFNRELALAGDPVCSRDGRKVLQIAYFPHAEQSGKLQVQFENSKAIEEYYEDGKYFPSQESGYDLFMAPKKKKLWIVVGRTLENGTYYITSPAYLNKNDIHYVIAEEHRVIEIEIEE